MGVDGWQIRMLAEVTDNFDFKRVPVKKADRRSGPYPYYGASRVVDHVDSYLFDGEYLLVAEDGENLRTRNTPVAFIATGKFWVNNHAHIIRGNTLANTRFLAYLLDRTDISGYLTGSTMPKLTQGNLSRITLLVPPRIEQDAIVDIARMLDDKIELNRRMNRTLEQMAAAIFKAWFVGFEPVKAKADGAKSFPSMPQEVFDALPTEFANSPLGSIPKDWNCLPLPDLVEVNPSRSLRKGDVAPYLAMADMPTQGHAPEQWIDRPFGSGMRFINGDTLVARITPCLENGKTAFVDFLQDGQIGWGSTEYIVLRPKPPLPPHFAYCLARNGDFRMFAIQRMTGSSGRQRVPHDCLQQFLLATPPEGMARAFADLVEPLFGKARLNMEESRTLAAIRDALLPKLLSGEIRVGEAERIVEEVA